MGSILGTHLHSSGVGLLPPTQPQHPLPAQDPGAPGWQTALSSFRCFVHQYCKRDEVSPPPRGRSSECAGRLPQLEVPPPPVLSALSFGCSSQLSFAKDHSEPRISNTRTWPSLYSRLEILKWPALAVGKGSAASPPLASRSRGCENRLSISLLHSLLLGSSGSDLGFGLCVVLQVGNLLTCQCAPTLCCPELGLPHSLSLSPLPEVWGPERLCSRSRWR